MERTAQERGLGPTAILAPPPSGNGDEVKRLRLRLAAVLKDVNLDLEDARPIASTVLNRSVERISELDASDLELAVAYVEKNRAPAQKIAALAREKAQKEAEARAEEPEQAETLPLDVEAAVPAGLASS